jgi:hypothetical protein
VHSLIDFGKQSVGWAKALLAPCPPSFESNVFVLLVGTPPDAFAPGRFAHPTTEDIDSK